MTDWSRQCINRPRFRTATQVLILDTRGVGPEEMPKCQIIQWPCHSAFDRSMAVNARSTFLCYKHAAKQMIAHWQGHGGRIIGAKISYPLPGIC